MKCSVIIPVYNGEDFIVKSVESALQQTLDDLEIIVIDDGSLDGTRDIAARIAAGDRRLRILQNSKRKGPSGARNTGLEAAKGEWIALLDADDRMSPCRLNYLITIAEERRLDAIADNLLLFDFLTNEVLGDAFPKESMQDTYLSLCSLISRDTSRTVYTRPIGLIKPIVRRQFIQMSGVHYDENISLSEDYLFYADLLIMGCMFGLVDVGFYHYAQRAGSLVTDVERRGQLLHVNELIRARYIGSSAYVSASRAERVELLRLVRRRGEAISYDRFVDARKTKDLHTTLTALMRVNPLYLIERLLSVLEKHTRAAVKTNANQN